MKKEEAQIEFDKHGYCVICGDYATGVMNYGKRLGFEDYESSCDKCFNSMEPWLSVDYFENRNCQPTHQ